MELIEFYTALLSFAGVKVNENGSTYKLIKNEKYPVVIDNKSLFLPTKEALRDVTDKCIFHPLTESVNNTESKVIQYLSRSINARLNTAAAVLTNVLLSIVASPEMHKSLTPDQTSMLVMIGDADATTVNKLSSITTKAFSKEETCKLFVRQFLKHGGVLHDKRYRRISVVSFPFLDLMEKGEFESAKLRAKDKVAYNNLIKYLLPNSEVENYYSFGSQSHRAPYLHALYLGALRVASVFNEVAEDFKDNIPEDAYENCTFNTSWIEVMDDLDSMIEQIRRVPPQNDNEGTVITTGPLDLLNKLSLPPTTPPSVKLQPVNNQQQNNVQSSSSKELTMSDILGHGSNSNPNMNYNSSGRLSFNNFSGGMNNRPAYNQPHAAPPGGQFNSEPNYRGVL